MLVLVLVDPLLEVVALDELADGALAVAGVLDEAGQVVGELLALVDERGDEGVEQRRRGRRSRRGSRWRWRRRGACGPGA